MSIDIDTLEDGEQWNSYVERSPQGGVFHRFEALAVQADHADATLHPLVGYKGQEPVGLFPVFGVRKGPVRTAFSPPPDLRVPYLGPALLNMDKLKQRKAERRLRRFVEGAVEHVDEAVQPRYTHVRTDVAFPDLRPFVWNEFGADPNYTYVVDLSPGAEDLLAAFSSDARSNVRNADPDAYTIEEGGPGAARDVFAQVEQRYAAQGVAFDVPEGFVADLHDRLPDGKLRPYVCRVGEEFAGGILVLDDGETVYRWLGGVRTDGVDLPVNDLLDWRVMTDAIDRGRDGYDLVGADNPRINRYKAKFAPELRTFHSLDRGSALVSLLAQGYKRLH